MKSLGESIFIVVNPNEKLHIELCSGVLISIVVVEHTTSLVIVDEDMNNSSESKWIVFDEKVTQLIALALC